MITLRPRRRATAAALSLAAVLTTTAAAPAPSPARPAAPAPAACPVQYDDKAEAAADRRVDLGRITPDPSWRTTCGTLYRADGRGPSVVFEEGFRPRDVVNGQYDLEKYVLVNQPSPYVSTTYDHDLFKKWKSAFNYYVDAPGGVDVNRTIGDTHKYADQQEVAFPGGIARRYIVGVCPVDKATKTEIMSECESNPHYKPWH
ncbi:ADP-ribosyltransferase [Streptomyces dubilierae]|uniref:ADP-ribosyltransferase n=1 Tax=Streptomyces dubilierae TaxID=3075533 RepID=A0ABU2PG20_9ACTN|nr:ADP-ribosyltransferase [Streptomyces sp. DSM 41921]MDT0390787.1 ADP-ribosyltransferase [Streptomyces sp. DSM 41921]